MKSSEPAKQSDRKVPAVFFPERASLLDRPAREASGRRRGSERLRKRLDFIRHRGSFGCALTEWRLRHSRQANL